MCFSFDQDSLESFSELQLGCDSLGLVKLLKGKSFRRSLLSSVPDHHFTLSPPADVSRFHIFFLISVIFGLSSLASLVSYSKCGDFHKLRRTRCVLSHQKLHFRFLSPPPQSLLLGE